MKVGIPEFLSGIGGGVETHVAKLETELGDLSKLLVTRTLKLKKFGIPCKHVSYHVSVLLYGLHRFQWSFRFILIIMKYSDTLNLFPLRNLVEVTIQVKERKIEVLKFSCTKRLIERCSSYYRAVLVVESLIVITQKA